jgi:hypothetical protein
MPAVQEPDDGKHRSSEVPLNAFRVLVTGFGVSTGPLLAATRDRNVLEGVLSINLLTLTAFSQLRRKPFVACCEASSEHRTAHGHPH